MSHSHGNLLAQVCRPKLVVLIVTHALETLLGRLVLSRLLVVAIPDTPALTVYHSLCDPKRCGIGALGDGIVKDPLDRLVVLLQALVEQA